MNRYLITLGRSDYNDPNYSRLEIGPEQETVARHFTDYFGYTHFTEVSTANLEQSHLDALNQWFLQKDDRENWLRCVDDLVVVYYTGHGALANDSTFRLVRQNSTPGTLFSTGLPLLDLLKSWIDSPIRHLLLILDVCHAGAAAEGLGEIYSHLNAAIPSNKRQGKSVRVITTSRPQQAAKVGRFPTALGEAFRQIQSSQMEALGRLALDDLHAGLNQALATANAQQVCQCYGGGDDWPAFFSLEAWRAGRAKTDTLHSTDASLYETELDLLAQFLDTRLGWSPQWLARLLPADRRQRVYRTPFNSTAQLVRFVCGLHVDSATGVCPLLVLGLRAMLEADLDAEPPWMAGIAQWRGADLSKCRETARSEMEDYRQHSATYRPRIKLVGAPCIDPAGSGDFTQEVDLQIWHDFEDPARKMIHPLGEWPQIHPAHESLGTQLEVHGQNCANCAQPPTFQITLPLHLLNIPVETIPISDGDTTCPLGAVYPVFLTAWERDYSDKYHPSRLRRKARQASLWQTPPPAAIRTHLTKSTPIGTVAVAEAHAPDLQEIKQAVNEGLPVLLWTRGPSQPLLPAHPWHTWHEALQQARSLDPTLDAALLWDDPHSGIRHLQQTPLRVPPRRPSATSSSPS